MRTVIAATDGSDSAARAVDFAAALARRYDAKLILVSVLAFQSHHVLDAGFEAILETEHITAREFLENEARAVLEKAEPLAKKVRGASVETMARVGEPTDTIMALARDYDDPVIVVGRRGRGRFVGLLLGSVSQKLVTHAPCPVLVVP
jgi:nucleotide-binding universal stress UspA family protein